MAKERDQKISQEGLEKGDTGTWGEVIRSHYSDAALQAAKCSLPPSFQVCLHTAQLSPGQGTIRKPAQRPKEEKCTAEGFLTKWLPGN